MDEAEASVFVCDAVDGRPVAASDAALVLLGFDAAEFLRLPAEVVAPLVESGRHRHTRPDGQVVEVDSTTQLLHGMRAGRLVVIRPAPAPLLRDPVDAATGLPGPPVLLERIEAAFGAADETGGTVALLFVDVETTPGDPTGEHVVNGVAQRLRSAVRRSDLVAKIGPGAFAVVCEHLQGEIDAAGLAAEVVDDLTLPLLLGPGAVFPSVGIGVALAGDPGMTAAEFRADPDAATLAAKNQGRARHAAFGAAAKSRSQRQEVMGRALREALVAGELDVHYQPVIDLRTGAVQGVEALARWLPPDGPAIPPDRFIPVAERTSLIGTLGEWVLRAACRFAAERPGLDVAVNVSPRQVSNDLVPRIRAILEESELPTHRLQLELTESAFLDDPDTATSVLRRLTALGVRLSLDDFGTGYSSLLVLRRLPFERLKIDRSFVRTVADTQADREVVAAVLSLARAVGVAATAEGVETDEQAAVLLDLGCQEAQGYLFGRPMPAEDCDAWLAADAAAR